MSENLKPCPFCGNEDVVMTSGAAFSSVYCALCGGAMRRGSVHEYQEQLLEAWNTRRHPPEVQAVLGAADQWEQYVTYTIAEHDGSERRSDAALVRAVRKLREAQP